VKSNSDREIRSSLAETSASHWSSRSSRSPSAEAGPVERGDRAGHVEVVVGLGDRNDVMVFAGGEPRDAFELALGRRSVVCGETQTDHRQDAHVPDPTDRFGSLQVRVLLSHINDCGAKTPATSRQCPNDRNPIFFTPYPSASKAFQIRLYRCGGREYARCQRRKRRI
jgi:hypothetical protein